MYRYKWKYKCNILFSSFVFISITRFFHIFSSVIKYLSLTQNKKAHFYFYSILVFDTRIKNIVASTCDI